jgi:hypothetical protein
MEGSAVVIEENLNSEISEEGGFTARGTAEAAAGHEEPN